MKNCQMIYVFSEWDFGFGNNDCFEGTVESVTKEIKEMYEFQGMEEEVDVSFKEAMKDGLIDISEENNF